MADKPVQQTTEASDYWSEAGEREEARRLAARIRWFEDDCRLLCGSLTDDLRDIARRLEEFANV